MKELKDPGDINDLTVLYRPSFGRKYGLGEFDFIIMSPTKIYLGESKLAKNNQQVYKAKLQDCQLNRHSTLHTMINIWFDLDPESKDVSNFPLSIYNHKPPRRESVLFLNLTSFFELVSSKYQSLPAMANVMLVFSTESIEICATKTLRNFSIINLSSNDLGIKIVNNYIIM